jgi:hypothetical protein
MPVTFLAHQGPLLPIARRWPGKVDGIALATGSMTPDLAWVLVGTSWEVRSHELPAALAVCVPMAVVIAWLVARVLAPVVADHLPVVGPFRSFDLRSYRGLATHRFGLVRSPVWAIAGVLSHVAIDQFTHDWGWASQRVDWYSDPLVVGDVMGAPLTPFRIAEYFGHIVLSLVAVWLLRTYGRSGWLRERAALVPATVPDVVTHLMVWGLTLFGALIAAALGTLGNPPWVVVLMRVLGGAFAGMCLGAVLVRSRPLDG